MNLLNKEGLLAKLTPFGVSSMAALNRLIREQGLPLKPLTPRKVFFEEAEIDTWLASRSMGVAKANETRFKNLKEQRKQRKEEKKAKAAEVAGRDYSRAETTADVKTFKKGEAV
jgi:hypothetical protein